MKPKDAVFEPYRYWEKKQVLVASKGPMRPMSKVEKVKS